LSFSQYQSNKNVVSVHCFWNLHFLSCGHKITDAKSNEFRPYDNAEPKERMSARDRVVAFFTAPGQFFADICDSPYIEINWRIPITAFVLVTLLLRQFMLTNPGLMAQMESKIGQELSTAVTTGQMSQEEVDQARAFARPGSAIFEIFLAILMAVAVPLLLFGLSLIYWLLGRVSMNSHAPFTKVVEVVGITFFVNIIEGIVTGILMYALNSITATPSLALFVHNFDPGNSTHLALSLANPFRIWDLSLLSFGLSRLFQRDLAKVLVIVFALWIVWSAATILVGIRLA
jgi:hypothetical protein